MDARLAVVSDHGYNTKVGGSKPPLLDGISQST
jgi:hypothetical protein